MGMWKTACRQLLAHPRVTAVAVLTLALGIGANTAIFSAFHAALLSALPYPQPEQLVRVYEALPDGERNAVSGGAFKDWHAHSRSFAQLAIYSETAGNFSGGQAPEAVTGLKVSSEFLSVLGIAPRYGRDLLAGEDAPARDGALVILADGFWRRRFGADPGIVGRTVRIDQVPHTVIGILPAHAALPSDALFLKPLTIDAEPEHWTRSGHWRQVIGRLAPGVSAVSAQAELRGIKQRLAAQYPAFKADWSVAVVPMREALAGDARPMLLTLLATAGFVLLIACANVSNLLLARGNARVREMAVRTALGAGRGHLVRQVLAESLLLALAGCGLGLLLALFGVDLLARMASGMLPEALAPALHAEVLLVSILVAAACGVLSGLAPALRASRPDLSRDLKESERGSLSQRRGRAAALLLVTQFAFTLVLLVGAGLFLRSFLQLLDTDPGFRPDNTLAFDLAFARAGYPEPADRMRAIDRLRERIAALPGVEAVGAASALPLSRQGSTEYASRADREPTTDYTIGTDFVSGAYFDAIGVPVLRGRALTAADNAPGARPVVVINQRLAADLYPGEDPLGRRLRSIGQEWDIVGVAGSVRHYVMHVPAPPRIYAPQRHAAHGTSMVVRSTLAAEVLAPMLREAVRATDPEQAIARMRPLDQDLARALAGQRMLLVLVGLFAALAVLLACVGIYGAMAHAVGQRTRELGIRAALGASRGNLQALVLRSGMKPALVGIAIGLLAALASARLLESLLFEIGSRDPLVFSVAALLLAGIAAWSMWLPARRATATASGTALRNE